MPCYLFWISVVRKACSESMPSSLGGPYKVLSWRCVNCSVSYFLYYHCFCVRYEFCGNNTHLVRQGWVTKVCVSIRTSTGRPVWTSLQQSLLYSNRYRATCLTQEISSKQLLLVQIWSTSAYVFCHYARLLLKFHSLESKAISKAFAWIWWAHGETSVQQFTNQVKCSCNNRSRIQIAHEVTGAPI